MKKFSTYLCTAILVLVLATSASAAVITFDDLLTGVTSYGFDGDGDSINDVILSTADPLGYNTVGPGANMTYVQEPGLEGSTDYDLRVDFLNQAKTSLAFGFALDDSQETNDTWVDFKVFDATGTQIAHDFELGHYTFPNGSLQSNFPEGMIETTFSGIASYALFDFNNDSTGGQRYIIDNFEGTFGSTEVPSNVPEPSTLLLLGVGLLGMLGYNRKHSQEN